MSDIEEKFEEYEKDPRPPCKYSNKCYQKNAQHHKKYKHPPKATDSDKTKNTKRKCENVSETNKKHDKLDTNNSLLKKIKLDDIETKPQTPQKASEFDRKLENVLEPKTSHDSSDVTVDDDLDIKQKIKKYFLVDMPQDFYDFWEFCNELKPTNTLDILMKDIGLKLVGPFDFLAGKFNNKIDRNDYLIHWRYYYDPPEFQTILKGNNQTGYHIGYFRDTPDQLPCFLACNSAEKDGTFTRMGDNIFAALTIYLEDLQKTCDPFKKIQIRGWLKKLADRAQRLNYPVAVKMSETIKQREKRVVAKTLNKLGLVVPYDKKSQLGYRELAMSDKDIATIMNKLRTCLPEQQSKFLSELQPVLTYASIALDECDFGTGIKLGWDLLYYGVDVVNSTISRFLSNSYQLLNRNDFGKIIQAHMKNRKTGSELSVL